MTDCIIPTDLGVLNVDAIITLVEILERHYDELPTQLQEALRELADTEVLEKDRHWFLDCGHDPHDLTFYVDGRLFGGSVKSINTVLKRIILVEEPPLYPQRFKVCNGEECILTWGC